MPEQISRNKLTRLWATVIIAGFGATQFATAQTQSVAPLAGTSLAARQQYEARQKRAKTVANIVRDVTDQKICISTQCTAAWAAVAAATQEMAAASPAMDMEMDRYITANAASAGINAMSAAVQDHPEWQSDPTVSPYLSQFTSAAAKFEAVGATTSSSTSAMSSRSSVAGGAKNDRLTAVAERGPVSGPIAMCTPTCEHPVKCGFCTAGCDSAGVIAGLTTCPETGPGAVACALSLYYAVLSCERGCESLFC